MTPTNLGRELGMDESKFAPCVTQGSYLNHLLESNSIIKIDEKISEGLFVGLHHAKEHPSFATIQNPNQIRLLLTGWGFYGDENVDDLHKVMNNPKSLEEAGNSIFINNQLCAIPISHVRNSILALVEGIFERQKHVNQLRDNLLTKCSIPFGDDLQSAFDQESLIDRISNVSPDEPSNEDLKLKIVSAVSVFFFYILN